MPIILNDIDSLTQTQNGATNYSPKFFSSDLTGTGKKVGLLSEANNPVNLTTSGVVDFEKIPLKKKRLRNGNTEINQIPMSIIGVEMQKEMKYTKKPSNDLTLVGEIVDKNDNLRTTVETDLSVHSITLEETEIAGGKTSKQIKVVYALDIFMTADANNEKYHSRVHTGYNMNFSMAKENHHIVFYTLNPINEFANILQELKYTAAKNSYKINVSPDAAEFFNDYSLYQGCVKQATQWQTEADAILDVAFENIAAKLSVDANNRAGFYKLKYTVKFLENYNLPLDVYSKIYKSIEKHFGKDDKEELCKQNLNLLLANTLENLNNNKASLSQIPQAKNAPVIPAHFSVEQKGAITTNEPLTLVQAGAGTGKSTVILGRVDYMIATGVNPKDIMVLSFTNAAANNITNRNPNIKSMTIAKMVHTIYQENFPTHELSSIETLNNSLSIYYNRDDLASRLKNCLFAIQKNERQAFTELNNLIETHYEKIVEILDTVKQTTLEIEIIICYQKIDSLKEPKTVSAKYLIIDEVQDNSIFEFIYTLKYSDKNKAALFIVGDCSQTLYEFRSANPKALNVLEGSGVFATYQLQINYRSNQAILDFANIALQDIEANQYANIQLQANAIGKTTEQDFKEKVHLNYVQLAKKKDLKDALMSVIAIDVRKWVDEKIKRKEKVAFLAYKRDHVFFAKDLLQSLYPNLNVASLVPEKVYNDTVLSNFIKKYWDEIKFVPTKSIATTIVRMILDEKLDFLVYDAEKARKRIQKLLNDWTTQNGQIVATWQSQFIQKVITKDEFLQFVKENLLQFEIKNNSIRQSLLSARNEEQKKKELIDNADLIVSTIHSAKGLEFENAIVLYEGDNNMSEENKRMYYVAFTRAMKSEYIIAFDKVTSPKIQGDYERICKTLKQKEKGSSTTFQIGETDDFDDDMDDDQD